MIPQKTKAVVLFELGHSMVLMDLEIPNLSPGQVLVKVIYSGLCHSQLMEVRGKRGPDKYLPHLLGHEGSGIVINIGNKVSKVKPGDKVVLTWIKGEGNDCKGSVYKDGTVTINAGPITTFSEYTVASENRCIKLSEEIPMDVASLFGCAVLTGAGIVNNIIKPQKTDSILIYGAGGIGLSALMAANLYGCSKIIVVDIEDEKLKLATEFGATHTISARNEDYFEKISNLTNGRGVDYAVEAAGLTSTIENAFNSVKDNGGLCVFASHPEFGEKICLDPFKLISGKQIQGSWGGESKPDIDIPRLAKSYKEGKLPLEKLITHRYSLEQINQALDDLENRKVARALIEM